MDETFAERLEAVELRMAEACAKAGRERESVRLLAVSKTKPPETVCEAAGCGLRRFGENKVQEAQAKIPQCPSGLEWHLIGHLQSNKARAAANLFHMIHSVDSLKLLQLLDTHAETVLPVLLQDNGYVRFNEITLHKPRFYFSTQFLPCQSGGRHLAD